MPKSLKVKFKSLRNRFLIDDAEYLSMCKKLDGHDKELLDKVAEKFIAWDSKVKGTREDNVCFFTIENILKVIEELKSEIEE